MGKRAASCPSDATSKPQKPAVKSLVGCWVVVTGTFPGVPRKQVMSLLDARGAVVVDVIDELVSHLIVGCSGLNVHGHQTGIGSSKWKEANRRGIPVVEEGEMWDFLEADDMDLMTASLPPPEKSWTLTENILYAMHSALGMGWKVVSLGLLASKIFEASTVDYLNRKNRAVLTSCLISCIRRGELIKQGSVYKLSPSALSQTFGASSVAQKRQEMVVKPKDILLPEEEVKAFDAESSSGISTPPHAPQVFVSKSPVAASQTASVSGSTPYFIRVDTTMRPKWQGLQKVGEKASPTGRAKCKGCKGGIAKGNMQLQFKDDTLYKIALNAGANKSKNGLIEDTGIPGIKYISAFTFWTHDSRECVESAERICYKKFMKDWNAICDYNDEYITD